MHRRTLLQRALAATAGAAGLVALPAAAQASAARNGRPARIGWLGWTGDTIPQADLPLAALREALAELGWREGANVTLVTRSGERDQVPALVAELVAAKVEVIIAHGPVGVLAKRHVGNLPLVFTINGDPVEAGLVASLARPGGNATGLTAMGEELAAKRVELLRQASPGLKRIAVLANDRHPGRSIEFAATRQAAQALGLSLQYFPVISPADFDNAFAAITADGAQGIVAFPDTLINRHAPQVAAFTRARRLPAVSGWAEFALAGNLMAYGPVHRDFYRRAAWFAHRILEGMRPAELPVERPTRLTLLLHRGAASAIGLTLPRELLLRADEVVG